jgi:hypothetical protein
MEIILDEWSSLYLSSWSEAATTGKECKYDGVVSLESAGKIETVEWC